MEQSKQATGQLLYSNYNYSFNYFAHKYKETCPLLSQTMSLRVVKNIVSTFVYEFSYAVGVDENWDQHKQNLLRVTQTLMQDDKLQRIMKEDDLTRREELEAYPKYYSYYISYLEIYSSFLKELVSTLMPSSSLTEKKYIFKNDNPFFERFHELKNIVYEALCNYNILKFKESFNYFITFYYAYNVFVNEKDRIFIEENIKKCLQLFTSRDFVRILEKYPDCNKNEIYAIHMVEEVTHKTILECNKKMNVNFALRGLNPRQEERQHKDRWLM